MKRAFRSVSMIGLALLLGAGIGVIVQNAFDVSAQTGNLLRKVGLNKSFDGLPEGLQDQAIRPTIPARLQGRLKLYVLVGQSNMVGRAPLPETLSTSANIFTFGNDYRWQVAQPPIDSSVNQVDLVSFDDDAAFGLAFPFAQTLITKDNNQIIGLIPCAKSGSSITDWAKNPSEDSLYGSCLKRVRAASTMGTVSGLLFFQGEADAIDPEQFPSLQPDADAWAEKFATFAFNFRSDIGNPALPMVYAQLGQPQNLEGLPNWGAVQQQQENIQIPNAAMVVTKDLPMEGLHFTVDSYRVIGQRFADAIAQINLASITAPDVANGESPAAESAQ